MSGSFSRANSNDVNKTWRSPSGIWYLILLHSHYLTFGFNQINSSYCFKVNPQIWERFKGYDAILLISAYKWRLEKHNNQHEPKNRRRQKDEWRGKWMRAEPGGNTTATCHGDRCSVKITEAVWGDWKKNSVDREREKAENGRKSSLDTLWGKSHIDKNVFKIMVIQDVDWVQKVPVKQRLRENSCCATWCLWSGLKWSPLRGVFFLHSFIPERGLNDERGLKFAI